MTYANKAKNTTWSTPAQAYEQRVHDGELIHDEFQLQALSELGDLHNALVQQIDKKNPSLFRKIKQHLLVDRMKPISGVYLHGDVGRGKSMLMDLFVETVPSEWRAMRVHFHAFMRDVHAFLHENRMAGINGLAKKLSKETDIICFDEFHVNDVADAMILQRLFTALIDWQIILVTTSNYPPDRLYENGLQRARFIPFIDLIKAQMTVIKINGPIDYRAQEMGQKNTYFYPLTPDTRQKCARLFQSFSKNEELRDKTLSLKGRTLSLKATSHIAYCTFAELCEIPAGAEDYIALSKEFETIFVTNIPRLTYDRRNETKRFMTLIDVLYDAQTRLVITAAEDPDHLYHGYDYEFEFPRTVSRLKEMTSQTYLSKWTIDHS